MFNPLTAPVRAAYLHWPFCQHKCAYCDFVSWPGGQPDRYVELILEEISRVGRWSQAQGLMAPLTTVFFGGGTPSLATPAQLITLLEALRAQIGIADDAEITFEANPGTVRAPDLTVLRQAGFNRISLGLQAAQDHLLSNLDRIHTRAEFIESVHAARRAGFTRISADLMLGLPGQTMQDVEESVDLVVDLGLDHVSYYSLIIEPGTPFYAKYNDHPELLPDEALERAMYHAVRARLAAAGLDSYEISNAAKSGQTCRHNLVYWQGEPYYGFGVAAHSYLAGVRRGNTANWADYEAAFASTNQAQQPAQQQVSDPFAAAISAEAIDLSEAQKEMILLGLRLSDGVRWATFSERFNGDARVIFSHEIARLIQRGLIASDSTGMRLTHLGLDLANQAFAEFV
ncbi:MAG: radical SAM family heme chaperone HemW [Eubacteriales bacterium]|nr:radical SAM family heme chaperone HemW [Eubacteriales bacterium]